MLSDPKKRAVYDELGVEGLKTTWEVGSRHKTPAEVSINDVGATSASVLLTFRDLQMRAEYERLGRKQLEANVENLVRSKVRLSAVCPAPNLD